MTSPTTKTDGLSDMVAWLKGASPTKLAAALPDLDDGGKPATEGAHSAANAADVRKAVPGHNVEAGNQNPAEGNQDKPIPGSGLAQTTTGKMPEVENAVKIVEDENAKMAGYDLGTAEGLAAAQAALLKTAAALPTLFAGLGIKAAGFAAEPPASSPPTAARGHQTTHTPADPTAAAFGYATKEAADQAALAVVEGHRRFGADRGRLTGRYLAGLDETYATLKAAAESGELQQMLAAGPPPGDDPAAMGGGPPVPPDAGGAMPPGAPAGPGAPAPGGDPAAAGGGPSTDDLAAAMAEMGVSPELLEQVVDKLRQMAGGAPGGMPPGGAPGGDGDADADDKGGDPAEKAARHREALFELAVAEKIAADVKAHMRSGKFRLKPAADGSPEAARRNAAHAYINELCKLAGAAA